MNILLRLTILNTTVMKLALEQTDDGARTLYVRVLWLWCWLTLRRGTSPSDEYMDRFSAGLDNPRQPWEDAHS